MSVQKKGKKRASCLRCCRPKKALEARRSRGQPRVTQPEDAQKAQWRQLCRW